MNLEETAKSWVQAALDLGQDLPVPLEDRSFSGRILVRLPESLHRRAVELAEKENTSLNQIIVSAVSERLGISEVTSRILERIEERLTEYEAAHPKVALS